MAIRKIWKSKHCPRNFHSPVVLLSQTEQNEKIAKARNKEMVFHFEVSAGLRVFSLLSRRRNSFVMLSGPNGIFKPVHSIQPFWFPEKITVLLGD